MILVSGCTRTVARVAPLYPGLVGQLLTPAAGNTPGELPYAADNACFTGFREDAYRRMLGRLAAAEKKPLWVCAPDFVGHSAFTLDWWPKWSMIIAGLGLNPCFVLQDGMESRELPDARAFFVGGSTKWKLSGHVIGLAEEVKGRGAWLHMGRVNSLRRLRFALDIGCDSVDGSAFSRWGNVFLEWALRRVSGMKEQRLLW